MKSCFLIAALLFIYLSPATLMAQDIPAPDPAAEDEEPADGEMSGEPDDVETTREAEMFGPADEKKTDVEARRDQQILSGEVMTDATLDEPLAVKQDPLAIGGLMYLRMSYDIRQEGQPEDFQLRTPNLVDAYLDARPNDRLRGFVRGRLTYDYTVDEEQIDPFTGDTAQKVGVALDQLWLKFDIARVVFLTVGKQRIKWGSNRFWNPTDFLNNERLDPLSVLTFDERLGVPLLKLHLPVESLGWNFYAIATLDDAAAPEDVGGALRGEFLLGLTEVALSGAVRRNNPYRLGADVSTGLGPFDLRVEAAAFHGDERPYYEGDLRFPATFPDEISREDEWIFQVSAGGEVGIRYSDKDTVYLGGEYFFNDAGYDDADLYPWLVFQRRFTPFYVGRHYAGVYGLLPRPGLWNDTTFGLSGFSNLSDQSYLVRFDYTVNVITYLALNAYGSVAFGENGELNFGLEIPPLGEFPGVDLAPPLFDVGVGLRLSI